MFAAYCLVVLCLTKASLAAEDGAKVKNDVHGRMFMSRLASSDLESSATGYMYSSINGAPPTYVKIGDPKVAATSYQGYSHYTSGLDGANDDVDDVADEVYVPDTYVTPEFSGKYVSVGDDVATFDGDVSDGALSGKLISGIGIGGGIGGGIGAGRYGYGGVRGVVAGAGLGGGIGAGRYSDVAGRYGGVGIGGGIGGGIGLGKFNSPVVGYNGGVNGLGLNNGVQYYGNGGQYYGNGEGYGNGGYGYGALRSAEGGNYGGENYAKGGGGGYNAGHHNVEGQKGEKGYKNLEEFDKGAKGSYGKEQNQGHYSDKGGAVKGHNNEAGQYGEAHQARQGVQGGGYSEKGGHKKGHKTTGYHNVYHKDEFKKEHSFYDDAHKDGHSVKYGNEQESHAAKKGGYNKGGFKDAAYQESEAGKKGEFDKGRYHDEHEGHKGAQGQEAYYNNKEDYGKKGAASAGKQYGYGSSSGGGGEFDGITSYRNGGLGGYYNQYR